jgi:methyl-accepting chemotaxis protein
MDTMTQQNAALVEEASAAAHALSGQATALTTLIARYSRAESNTQIRSNHQGAKSPALRSARLSRN